MARVAPPEASTRAYVDASARTYRVVSPDGDEVGREGPFPTIGDLVIHVQSNHPGVWLAADPDPEPF